MADQNGIVLITAFISDQKLKGFQEILKFLSKAERRNLLRAVCDFCLAKTTTSANAGTNVYFYTDSRKWANKDFVIYLEGESSVRNEQDELVSNISVLSIGRILQFFNCQKFVMFSDGHQLSESSFQRFDSIKITSVECLRNLVAALPPYLLLEPPPDFVKVLSWIFNLRFVQTLWCWLSNVEKQTWHIPIFILTHLVR